MSLSRFQRSMVSRRADTCGFCGTATAPGIDFAVLNNGKWMGACTACAGSTHQQARALLLTIQAEAQAFGVGPDVLAQVNSFAHPNTPTVIQGKGEETEAVEVVAGLFNALSALRLHKPENPLIAMLRPVIDSPKSSAWARDFAVSVIRQIEDGRTLSEKQLATAHKLVAELSAPVQASAVEVEHGGIYVAADSYYLVRLSKAGRFYAMILASAPVEGHKLDWQYCQGGIQVIKRSGRAITAEEAAALGHVTKHCCFCDLELSNEEAGKSVDVGYGPVCAKRRGLPWG